MSGRSRVILADGRECIGYRKTLRRNPRRFDPWTDSHLSVPFTLSVVLPGTALASPGPTAVIGVTIEQAGSELRAIVSGHGLEFVFRQFAEYFTAFRHGTEERMAFTIQRGNYRASSRLIYQPGKDIRVPRRCKRALVFAVKP